MAIAAQERLIEIAAVFGDVARQGANTVFKQIALRAAASAACLPGKAAARGQPSQPGLPQHKSRSDPWQGAMAHTTGRLWQSPPPFGDHHADTQILRVGVVLSGHAARVDTTRGVVG